MAHLQKGHHQQRVGWVAVRGRSSRRRRSPGAHDHQRRALDPNARHAGRWAVHRLCASKYHCNFLQDRPESTDDAQKDVTV